MKSPRNAAAVPALIAALSLAATARADVKIVQKVTVTGIPKEAVEGTGQPDPSKPQTVTTYLKGDKVRLENGRSVLIFDGAADRVYALDSAAKTYMELPLKDFGALGANPAAAAMLTFDTTADVKDTGENKSLAGKASHRYAYTATIKMGLGANPSMSSLLPTVKLEGEQWTTEAITVPPGYARLNAIVGVGAMRRALGKGLDPLTDKLTTIKGVPLSSRETTTFVFADPNSPFAAQAPKNPVVKTTEVTSVSEAPIGDDLFALPADYKKVETPAPPAAPKPVAPAGAAPAPTAPAPK
jgi:hypothetical protein